jgi:hypothetical protein
MPEDTSPTIVELKPVAAVEGLLRKLVLSNYMTRRRFLHKFVAEPRYTRFLYKFRALQQVDEPVEGGPVFTDRSVNELRTILALRYLLAV